MFHFTFLILTMLSHCVSDPASLFCVLLVSLSIGPPVLVSTHTHLPCILSQPLHANVLHHFPPDCPTVQSVATLQVPCLFLGSCCSLLVLKTSPMSAPAPCVCLPAVWTVSPDGNGHLFVPCYFATNIAKTILTCSCCS